ncbi:MAG: hypothetical protein DMD29_06615 [Gemmatimonadetes bacterium]|nr:MAG: hypothetical protein DMD29_06615 [Gemmatimonadota bacterium]
MLRETPFHPRTAPLCESQAWRRWAGYVVASSYELTHDREYHAIRSSAALLDVSPLYKYLITGPDAERLLDRVVTRNVGKTKVGQVLYTPWCDAAGKVIDDGTISRLGEQTFRLTAADPNLRWLHLNAIRLNVRIEDVSASTAALALQGPSSRAILEELTATDLTTLKYYRLTAGSIRGIPVTISRTGYITPCGMLALDLARIEAGLLLLEVDYVSAHHALLESQKSSPFELNLGWTVSLEKEWFVGKPALVAEAARGAAWQLVGLEVDWDSLERLYAEVGLPPRLPTTAWRTSVPVYVNGTQVGYATSGCWSPVLKKYLALAHVRGEHARPGSAVMMEVTVEHHRKRAAARVAKTPFFNPERKRA